MGPDEFAAILIGLGFIITGTVSGLVGWCLRGGHDAAKRLEFAGRINEYRRGRLGEPGHTVEMRPVR